MSTRDGFQLSNSLCELFFNRDCQSFLFQNILVSREDDLVDVLFKITRIDGIKLITDEYIIPIKDSKLLFVRKNPFLTTGKYSEALHFLLMNKYKFSERKPLRIRTDFTFISRDFKI